MFFNTLPTIYYGGQQVKNILARAKLDDKTKGDVFSFYPYTIRESDSRPDVIAHRYYEDANYVWLLYFANEVVDPYYDMGISEGDFDNFIAKKHGSIENAQKKIAFYRTNWDSLEESTISPETYENLAGDEKKYYIHKVNMFGEIVGYDRKKEDVVMATNRIVQLELQNANGTFTTGEKVSVDASNYGFVTFANSSVMTLQHLTGTFNYSTDEVTYTLTGDESAATADIKQSETAVHWVANNIPQTIEAKYWNPVSYYDLELEIDRAKKNINILDVRYASKMEDQLRNMFRT